MESDPIPIPLMMCQRPPSSSTSASPDSPLTIPCCIVDDHCDVIPFLHACWQAKKIQFADLALLHVDSHPDLVVPACSVTEMHDKELLYDLLEETGGISEFILPLHATNVWMVWAGNSLFLLHLSKLISSSQVVKMLWWRQLW